MFAHSFWLVRDGSLVRHWNLQNYRALFTNPLYFQVFLRTARIAASVTLCSLLLGYPLAYYLSFHAGPRKELLYQLVIVPLWVSDLLAPLLVGGPSSTMIANIVQSLFGAAYDWPLGAAISVCILLITVSLLFTTERLEKRWSFK